MGVTPSVDTVAVGGDLLHLVLLRQGCKAGKVGVELRLQRVLLPGRPEAGVGSEPGPTVFSFFFDWS